MDYKILFSNRSLGDLEDLLTYIARDSEIAASEFGVAMLDHIDQLRRFPRMGSEVPYRIHVRKLVHTPVVVYYSVDDARRIVEVLHVRHGARREPDRWP